MNKIIPIIIVLFGFQDVLASGSNPPPPRAPVPPGLPIDGGLVVLFAIALLFGFYISKKYISMKKGSL